MNNKKRFIDFIFSKDGGKGSGNFGHEGRPGQIGGSGNGGGLTRVSSGSIKAQGYSLRSSKLGRSKNADRVFVTKGNTTRHCPKGSGSTVLSEADLKNGVHSCIKHIKEDGTLTEERAKLHDELIDKTLEKGVDNGEGNRTFYILGGGPASGKGSITAKETHEGFGMPDVDTLPVIDPDEFKKQLPEYGIKNREAAANFVHEESSALGKRAMEAAFENGYDCVLDGTGDGSLKSIMKKIENARKKGYKVEAAYVTCPTEMAIQRAIERGEKTGRVVKPNTVRKTHAAVSEIFPKVASEFDHVALYDTSGKKGEPPVKIAECWRGQEIRVYNKEKYQAFLDKAKET